MKRRLAGLLLWLPALLQAAPGPDFTLHRLDGREPGPTLLVIGGIQGDEPGGFHAASLLVTDYRIERGHLWVVPNLNFPSILARSRGVHGDMNRKFADIRPDDPEYAAVQKIKRIILDPQVDMVLNLHDGSGFYRPRHVDRLHNPRRWGQSVIIDQAELPGVPYGDLAALAAQVRAHVNAREPRAEYRFHVRNTRTREGDAEMEKTLTYFAIRHGKPAFGIEASKTFLTHRRARYHLLAVEGFMQTLGIRHRRDFPLTAEAVRRRIDANLRLALYDARILLDVSGGARARLGYIPMPPDRPLAFTASNPLLAIVGERDRYRVRYGNRHVTLLEPQYFEFDDSLERIMLEVDGEPHTVPPGSLVPVRQRFRVTPLPGYRVNVIGFRRPGQRDESGVTIRRQDIASRFSVDRRGRRYRVEFYRGNRFSGMVLVEFVPAAAS